MQMMSRPRVAQLAFILLISTGYLSAQDPSYNPMYLPTPEKIKTVDTGTG